MDDRATRNAFSTALIAAIMQAIDEMQHSVRVIVLRACPGVATWSSGHDIRELPTNGRDPLAYNDPLRQLVRRIRDCPLPVVAMVEGGVWGGGCEVMMSCDLVVAATNATFALTPAKIGVPYNVDGILNMMSFASPSLVKDMLFRAGPINAERALLLGLVNDVVPREALEARTLQIALEIAANSPLVLALVKEQMKSLAEAHPLTPETFERIQGMRRAIYDSEDYREGIRSFFEKRQPQFHGK
jgi:methylmalonyl-CoA decarboxylase